MKLDILGCSGGIGKGLKTTTFLLNDHFLLDAGTGLEILTLDQMLAIRTVVITHAHIDHIIGLPLMLATIFDQHTHPIDVYANDDVITALENHIFNWTIWPDYTQLPEHQPIVRLHRVNTGEQLDLDGYHIQVLPAVHPTPTVGYHISDGQSSFCFTGDTGCNPELWPILNELQPQLVIIDVSFTDDVGELAQLSGHLTPSQLKTELDQLQYPCDIKVTHLKPGFEKVIMQHCKQLINNPRLSALEHGESLIL